MMNRLVLRCVVLCFVFASVDAKTDPVFLGAKNAGYLVVPAELSGHMSSNGLLNQQRINKLWSFLDNENLGLYGTGWYIRSSGFVPEDIFVNSPILPKKIVDFKIKEKSVSVGLSLLLHTLKIDAEENEDGFAVQSFHINMSAGVNIYGRLSDGHVASQIFTVIGSPIYDPSQIALNNFQDLDMKWLYCQLGSLAELSRSLGEIYPDPKYRLHYNEAYADWVVYVVAQMTLDEQVIKALAQP